MNHGKLDSVIDAAIASGRFRVDADGSVWRIGRREERKGLDPASVRPVVPRRCDYVGAIGYRFLSFNQTTIIAHRLVWTFFNGRIPVGFEINHKDGNRANNHPGNLEAVPPAENKRHAREVLLARVLHGTAIGTSNLTEADVADIRRRLAAGERTRRLAAEYGVGSSAISCIGRGKTWRHTLTAPPGAVTPAQAWRAAVGIGPSVANGADFCLPSKKEAIASGICWMCRSAATAPKKKTCQPCLDRYALATRRVA